MYELTPPVISTTSKKEARTYLILTLVLGFIACLFWYIGVIIAVAMSFDSGVSVGVVITDILILIGPLCLWLAPLLLSYLAFRKKNYDRSVSFLKITWYGAAAILCLLAACAGLMILAAIFVNL